MTTSTTTAFSAPTRTAIENTPLFTKPTPANRATGRFFEPITWRALGLNLLMLPVGILIFTYAVTAVSLGASLAVLIIGLPVAVALLFGSRGLGNMVRSLTNATVGTRIARPVPLARKRGFWGYVTAALADAQGWRSLAFHIISFMVAIIAFVCTVTFLALGPGMLTYGIWYKFLPEQQGPVGVINQGAQLWDGDYIDTFGEIAGYALIGLLISFYVWPAINNGFARLHALLAAGLLGPTEGSVRKYQLEVERLQVAEAQARRMSRIERDLHDITQAQLVSIAMKVGDAKDRIESGELGDFSAYGTAGKSILETLSSAHSTAKTALSDLRALVQGIHPAALNDGLETALGTLLANAALPVDSHVRVQGPVAQSVEVAAYYCVAELVNNAAKHSGADRVYVSVQSVEGALDILVQDNGRGGAQDRFNNGTGLAGVADRVNSVNGSFQLHSPQGGPTQAHITLPQTPRAGQ